jgi:hypothetical protein
MGGTSSPDTSPVESDLEKGALEKDLDAGEHRKEEEEIEEIHGDEQDSQSARDGSRLRLPLQQIRSHSSARSTKSYTDGYSHWEEEEERQTQDQAARNEPDHNKEFEVKFDGDNDPLNPKCKPTRRKWTIVLIGSFCSLCVTCASALYTSTYLQMEEEYGISREVATVGLTTYVCGLGLGPMVLGPLSEFYGRRIIYLCAFGGFFVWLIPCAVAPDIGSMLVCPSELMMPLYLYR